jgi:hypothetical protein
MNTRTPEDAEAVDPLISSILELGIWGRHWIFSDATLIWTTEEDPGEKLPVREFSLAEAWRLLRAAHRNRIGLIVVQSTCHPPWHWRPLRSVLRRPFAPWRRFVRLFGTEIIRFFPRKIPLFVVDRDDQRTIARHNLFLLDRCTYYFKRELPVDRWQVFQKTAHPEMPSTRFRRNRRNRTRIEKLRPWAMGYMSPSRELSRMGFPEKNIGLFVAVSVYESSTVRIEGMTELRALAARRNDIFIAEHRMPQEEFVDHIARAWLTWSPEGFGWDCGRHYEAAVFYSIPVINQPTIVRYRPLLEGVHALHYSADVAGDLTRVIETALADRDRLKEMAIAAREYVSAFHLDPWSRADQLIRYAKGLEEPPGGLCMSRPNGD